MVNEAAKFAEDSPEPAEAELYTDVSRVGGKLMATQLLMPALSPTMEEGTLAKWLVKEGDAVKSGDILAEIETDKATMEFEAVDEGTIGKILVAEGTDGVKVDTPIAVLLERGRGCLGGRRRRRPRAAATVAEPEASAGGPPCRRSRAVARKRTRARARGARGHATFRNQTVREALRDAMAEEMRRDDASS